MPRLLLLCEYPTLCGGEHSMLSTLPAVAAAGFDVRVASPPEGPLVEAVRQCGVETIALRLTDTTDKRRPLDAAREQVAQVLRECQPDLVHSNSLSMGRIAGPVASSLTIRGVVHLRDIIKLSGAVIADLNSHDRLLAVSRATREFHLGQGLDGEKTVVLHNGVDLQKFSPGPMTGCLQRELGLPQEAVLVGAIGQIGLRKGFDVLLEAARRVVEQVPAAHFVILGARFSEKAESRQFEAGLREQAASPPLAGRVYFLGVRDDVSEVLRELTLLVHPARQEPLGRVLLEAAATGLPIVATDVGGTREIFPPETNSARLIVPDDAASLASAVIQLLGDDRERAKIGAAARDRAKAAFDLQRATRGLIEQYRQVLAIG